MQTLNSRNRKTTWFSKVANLQFNYTISKNITAQAGQKTIYLRIIRPDDEVMTKSEANVFQFEDKQIAYSAKKTLNTPARLSRMYFTGKWRKSCKRHLSGRLFCGRKQDWQFYF